MPMLIGAAIAATTLLSMALGQINTGFEALGVVERIEEPRGLVVVEHDPRALGEDLLGARTCSAAVELTERDAQRRGRLR